MPRRNFFLPLLAFGMAVFFALALVRLLLLRYERGDVYPAYSTMRADPLGTRALYEALQATGRYKVARGFASLHRELETKPDALFYLGFDVDEIPSFDKDEVAALDDYVKKGGRAVITLAPEEPSSPEENQTKKDDKKNKKTEAKSDNKADQNPSGNASNDEDAGEKANPAEPETKQEKYEREQLRKDYEEEKKSDKDLPPPEYHKSLAALWGFGWDVHSDSENKKRKDDGNDAGGNTDETSAVLPEVFALRTDFAGTEANVPWKSALYFVRLESDWTPLYNAKGKPVLIARHWGKGEVVVATDSYFVSNEALRNDRRADLLAFMAGAPGQLLFDEGHLGTQEQEGIMTLAEKFRLEGFLYGMIGALGLFLWRNSTPLVPPRTEDAQGPRGGTISGKDSRSGLVNLLRRNISRADILKVCLAEWKRGVTPRRTHLRSRLAEMESIVGATSDQPGQIIQSYHDLSRINAPGKMRETHATKS
ncbi:MAG TPA: DUF4350 domain-containing protein [Candidatus Methylacidiphilales bacterium]|nr:DUF4350 domain-containing protein [Candidatus Methylacidiphilales bacterium]